ncbi:RNA polymerase sigma factor sigma-70 region 4 domain-containing protein [Thermococcus peptonophilus]|uniref:hypothetical protein n=1 Tax=Thermococcus peptonophilus TaxID=53952 RepID=UPI000AB33C2C
MGVFGLLFVAEYYRKDYVVITTQRKRYSLMTEEPEAVLRVLIRGGSPMLKLPEGGMERVWLMRAKDMREVEIAEALGISRQAVNKALKDARVKLFEAFFSIAETFSLDVVRVNAEKGFAVFTGKVLGKRVRVYAFYLPGKGGIRAFFGGDDVPDYILQHALKVRIIEKPEKERLIRVLES